MSRYRKTMVDALREVNEIGTDQYRKYLEKITPGQGKSLDEKLGASQISALKKAYEPMRGKKISSSNGEKLMKIMDMVDKDKKTLIQLFKADIPFVSELAAARLISKHNMKGAEINKFKESVELDEHKGTKPHPHPHKEKDEARKIDPADIDHDATDDDVKAADKNIIMQMRKVVSLRGNFKVEFGDKKKIKIDPKIAMAVQDKYNSFRKADDKEKFQAKVSKSYKDMLSAIKEGFSEEVELDELKMNDPKLNKVFDKLKPKATVQVKTSSSIAKGKDFKTYLVVSKNTLRNGTEKITLKNRENPTGVKSFLYRRDGSVTFAIGDMGASIDDIKEEVDLDEGKMSQLHQHIKDGKSAKEIAKIMKLDVKTIKALMGEELKEGTWGLPDTPKLMAGLKQLMKKPIPLGKDGDDAIKAIGKYIGDDGLYDDLYDAGKKDGPTADARPVISGWMDRNFTDSWKKYRIETTTILDRIDKKLKEKRNG